LCLQKVKASALSDSRCFSLWGDNKVGWIHNEGVSGAESMLTMWHKGAFGYERHVMGKDYITIFGQHIASKCHCAVINIYASCNLVENESLWAELSNIKCAHQNLAWCFYGDFNIVKNVSERRESSVTGNQKNKIRDFNSFIERNYMVELPVVSKKYIWFKANDSTKSKLNRVMVSEEWIQKWSGCKQHVQSGVVSDHCAIVVKSLIRDYGPKPFRSIDAWLLESGFKEMVGVNWRSYCIQGNNITRFKEKLKSLKAGLKIWNRDVFGCMVTRKKRIVKEIEDIDNQDDTTSIGEKAKLRRTKLLSQMRLLDSKMESLCRQKAREKWLKYGDSNSRYYHLMLRWRHLRNGVKGMNVNNLWCEELEVVCREAKKMFQVRYQAT